MSNTFAVEIVNDVYELLKYLVNISIEISFFAMRRVERVAGAAYLFHGKINLVANFEALKRSDDIGVIQTLECLIFSLQRSG